MSYNVEKALEIFLKKKKKYNKKNASFSNFLLPPSIFLCSLSRKVANKYKILKNRFRFWTDFSVHFQILKKSPFKN